MSVLDVLDLFRSDIIAGKEVTLETLAGEPVTGDALAAAAAAADESAVATAAGGDADGADGAAADRDSQMRLRLSGLADGQEPPLLSHQSAFKSQKGTGPFYTLGQLWRFHFHKDLTHAKYLSVVGGTGVSFVDRKELMGYLTGKLSKSRSVKKLAPAPTPAAAANDAAPAAATTSDAVASTAVASGGNESAAPPAGATVPPAATSRPAVAAVKQEAAKGAGGAVPARAPSKDKKGRSSDAASGKSGAGGDAPSYVAPKFPTVETPKDAVRQIVSRELSLYQRKSVLRTGATKHTPDGQEVPFFRPLVEQVQYIDAVDKEIEQLAKKKISGASGSNVSYDRYNPTDKFWKERLGKEAAGAMNLEAGGGGLADVAKQATAAPMSAADAAAAGAAAAAVAQATEAKAAADANSRKRGAAAAAGGASKRKSLGASGALTSNGPGASPLATAPILIVPPAGVAGAPITIRNIRALLEAGRFEVAGSTPVAGERGMMLVSRGGGAGVGAGGVVDDPERVASVCVVSNPRLLGEAGWARVIGVVTHGADWQFKSWKWPRPVELFSNVRGFFIRFNDQKTPPSVRSWNVKQVVLDRNKRHTDQKLAQLIWSELDQSAKKR